MVTRVPTRNHQLQSFWAAPIPTMAMNARKTIPWVGNCRPATAHVAPQSGVSNNVETFLADLRDHGKAGNTLLFMFSECSAVVSSTTALFGVWMSQEWRIRFESP